MVTVLQISDEDNILRRVPTKLPNYIKDDGTISSMAFRPPKDSDGLSVDLERLSSYEKATLGKSDFRLLRLNVGVVRNEINDGLEVVYNPMPDNDAHSLITGTITKSKMKDLLSRSEEVDEPLP